MKKQFTIFLILIFVFGLMPTNFSVAEKLSDRLKGRILLQVESNGEAWYINPDNSNRYFLGRPADAFNVMRELGLGISNKDFDSFNNVAPKRLSGKILLKVEDSGKAYYVNPVDFKMHFLGRPADAFKVMRELGLGISNNDLKQIQAERPSLDEIFNRKTKNEKVENLTINDFLSAVVEVKCGNQKGSGFIRGDYIMTNKHVIEIENQKEVYCLFFITSEDGNDCGLFAIKNKKYYQSNPYSDFAALEIIEDGSSDGFSLDDFTIKHKNQLNDNVKKINKCSEKMIIGSKVYIIGYPAYARQTVDTIFGNVDQQARILTEGIISGYDSSSKIFSSKVSFGNLPYDDYYVSNRIDSGNSGGLALSKENGSFCLLGMPTWISIGNYETQGIVQNIRNIMHKE